MQLQKYYMPLQKIKPSPLSIVDSFKVTRRQLLKTGFAGSMLLTFVGAVSLRAEEETTEYDFLTTKSETILFALFPAVLDNLLPDLQPEKENAIREGLKSLDTYLAHMSLPIQEEFNQLFDLLSFPPFRIFFAGIWNSWDKAPPYAVKSFLLRFRNSRLSLFRSVYSVLQTLVSAGWFASPISWEAIGYPGPPQVTRPEGEGQL